MKKTIITIVGNDKPGIIASTTEFLLSQHCNIENITQTILQTEFACLCIAGVPETISVSALEDDFRKSINDPELNIHCKEVTRDVPPSGSMQTEPFIATTIGPDRKGLVANISRVIADEGVNIKNLKAVFHGGNVPDRNIMMYELEIPGTIDINKFADKLKQKATELNLELTFQHKNIFDRVNRI